MKKISITLILLCLVLNKSLCASFFSEWSDFNKRMRNEFWESMTRRPFIVDNNTSNNNANITIHRTPQNTDIHPRMNNSSVQLLSDIKGTIPQEIYNLRDYLNGSDFFAQAGARQPTGILLVGKPGTGKTTIARALAHELNIPFIAASGSEFIEKYVGVGAQRVRELFTKAQEEIQRTNAKHAIIFIDEIDAIGNRNQDSGSHEEHKTVTQLLTLMDGFSKDGSIIVMAATNHISTIDPALLRPGRFDEIIEIPLPNCATRLDILNHYLTNPKFKRSTQGQVTLEKYAASSEGWSGAELESVINKAAIEAARSRRKSITQADLDTAFKQVACMRTHRR